MTAIVLQVPKSGLNIKNIMVDEAVTQCWDYNPRCSECNGQKQHFDDLKIGIVEIINYFPHTRKYSMALDL